MPELCAEHWITKMPPPYWSVRGRVEWTASVLRVDYDGEPWSAATNGRWAMLVRGLIPGAQELNKVRHETMLRYLRLFLQTECRVCETEKLRKFAGPAEFPRICTDEGCDHFGEQDPPYRWCGKCDVDGEIYPKHRYGICLGVPIDRMLLAQLLAYVPDDELEIGTATAKVPLLVVLHGRQWCGGLSSISRSVNNDDEFRDAPVFDLQTISPTILQGETR